MADKQDSVTPIVGSNQVVALSEQEYLTLKCWGDMSEFWGMEEVAFGYKPIIADTGMTKEQLQPIIATLKSKGFLEYSKGLMNEEGEMGGSGWSVTRKGADAYYEHQEQVTDLVATDKEPK